MFAIPPVLLALPPVESNPMRIVVWSLVILLIIIHQDFWFWDDKTLVFGFIPIGLLYHAGISVAAAFTWFLATIFCWPEELEYDDPAAVPAVEATGGEA